MSKILVGGIAGGVVLFAWGAVVHMFTPLGGMGMRAMPDEVAVVATLKGSLPAAGLYVFPGDSLTAKTDAELAAHEAKMAAGPMGLLVYQSDGMESMLPQLTMQFCIDVATGLVMALVLASTAAGMSLYSRARVAALLGLFATLAVNAPYWNWYGFPASFTAAALLENVAGAFLAGLLVARLCPPCASCSAG